jgi:hypothetical protein
MINNCPAKIKLIDEDSVIGDTLQTFNDNFATLKDIVCATSNAVSILSQASTGSISKIKSGVGIVVEPETGFVTVSQSYSPPWHIGSSGKPLYEELEEERVSQQVKKSAVFLNYLNQLASLTPALTGSDSYTLKYTNNGANAVVQYNGVVTLSDGRLLLLPGALDVGSIYDPTTGIFSKIPVQIPAGFANGILLPNGSVCLVPGAPKNIAIWNPQTNVLITSKIDLSITGGSTPYNGGTLLPNGKIMLTPYGRKDGTVIYDPLTDTVKHIYSSAFTTVGGNGFFSGAISLDGKYIYLAPHDSQQMVKVSLNAPYTVSFVGTGNLGITQTGAFSSSVQLPNGKIFLTPYNASSAALFDPVANTITLIGRDKFTVNAKNFITSILLPDGRVCMVPYGATAFAYYNYKDDSFTFSKAVGATLQKYRGATVLESGDIFVAPYTENRAIILNPGHQQGFTRATVTGPFFKETL